MHAIFNKDSALNQWTIPSRTLKEFTDHFGPKTEQLDLYTENGRTTFTSYTEKITDGKEILKQPLQTSVTVDTSDFENFTVQERLHIGISVKDFKAIVIHAETLKTSVKALFSYPTRPMQLLYQAEGMLCEFTLMTIGDYRGTSVTPAPAEMRSLADRTVNRAEPTGRPNVQEPPRTQAQMLPPQNEQVQPPEPSSLAWQEREPSHTPATASLERQSLFFAEHERDRRWDPPDFSNEDEDILRWDPSADESAIALGTRRNIRDTRTQPRTEGGNPNGSSADIRVAPTQRVSE
ncbi:MAG: hypothetical protein M1817_002878, partial [Caeruleum heppii]